MNPNADGEIVRLRAPALGFQASVHVAAAFRAGPLLWDGVVLPDRVRESGDVRRAEFVAGRWCAAEAMAALIGHCPPLGINDDRSPAWPAGLVGSITHTAGIAAAAVARAAEVVAVGLDSERVVTTEVREQTESLVLLPGEKAMPGGESFDPNELHTLAFSAKESVYKALAPLAGRYFDFLEVTLTRIDPSAGHFTFRLLTELCDRFRAGFSHTGSFAFEGGLVHTAVEILVPAAGSLK